MSEPLSPEAERIVTMSDAEYADKLEVELLQLRAVVANAVALINSGRCGLGLDVLTTGKVYKDE